MTWLLALNLLGLTIMFVGNNLVVYAVGRWGARHMPHFVWGNRIQYVGYAISILAIFLST